ncbi:MAG: class I SAM-dependent methyltransferase [Elusimicrobia bacterium]|nr:class I SAM-dependent methyltransferase [Elusimicrobiota bacterium]
MNLPDLLRRKDRAVLLISGEAEPMTVPRWEGHRHAVRLEPGSLLRLQHAFQFRCLEGFPASIHWDVSTHPGLWSVPALKSCAKTLLKLRGRTWAKRPLSEFALDVLQEQPPKRRHTLFCARMRPLAPDTEVRLDWPSWIQEGQEYHLELSVRGELAAYVLVAPVFDARSHIIPLLRGDGVEVGPGLNPRVLPSRRVRVRYVESTPAREWVGLYKKRDQPSPAAVRDLWGRYIPGDGGTLAMIEDGALDFIFSNHVLEHMLNPLGILENWARKLKPGGILAGVVPDLRYTFDLRQPPSLPQEWLRERAAAVAEIPMGKYERWCRYTAPYNTPADLIARGYSIHIHYYTPETFVAMTRTLVEEGVLDAPSLHQSPNNKDFGFVMRRRPE